MALCRRAAAWRSPLGPTCPQVVTRFLLSRCCGELATQVDRLLLRAEARCALRCAAIMACRVGAARREQARHFGLRRYLMRVDPIAGTTSPRSRDRQPARLSWLGVIGDEPVASLRLVAGLVEGRHWSSSAGPCGSPTIGRMSPIVISR